MYQSSIACSEVCIYYFSLFKFKFCSNMLYVNLVNVIGVKSPDRADVDRDLKK